MWLLVVSAFGLIVPNGLFLYWLFVEYQGLTQLWSNRLALAFIMDAFIALALLSYWYARHPIGRVRWPVFVALSIIGGLAFSLPLYWWLNQRKGTVLA